MNTLPSAKFFEKALAIKAPWIIDKIASKTTENNEEELHIYLSFMHGEHFCDATGAPCSIHSMYEKTWQHVDFEEQRCYIHCKTPRIKTTEGSILTLDVPWARSGSRFSRDFEINVMQEIQNDKPLDTVGSLFRKTSPRIWTIFNDWVMTAHTKDVIDKDLSTIGIDEIIDQEKKKQITVTVDLNNERVIHVTKGIRREAIQNVCAYLTSKGISPGQIKHVGGPFLSEQFSDFLENMRARFPNAKYHIDRLYITKLLNETIDQIRKKESYRTKKLTESRALFIKHPALLSDEQKKEVQKLSAQFPNVGKAYELKNNFFALWDQASPQAADIFLESWCQEVSQTKISPLKHAAELLKKHKQYIVRFLDLPADSSVMEKIHENILAATKRTKGLKNFENVSHMILFCCGKLTFPHTQS